MTSNGAEYTHDLFQLQTLYDVSKELFEAKDTETVLQNFLLTILGSMGVMEGLIALHDGQLNQITPVINRGIDEEALDMLHQACAQFFSPKYLDDFQSAEYRKNTGKFPQNIKTVVPFGLDERTRGVLLLGDRLSAEGFAQKDIDLLLTLTNHLIIALRNANILQQMACLNKDLERKNLDLEKAFEDLDRRVYHLKTLNDISRDIFSTVEFDAIINHFLLMIMGNFGVMQGAVLMAEGEAHAITYFKNMGCDDAEAVSLKQGVSLMMQELDLTDEVTIESIMMIPKELDVQDMCALPFRVTEDCIGCLCLGAKIIGEPFNEDDKELIVTLVNSLIVALKNSLSFDNIKQLNQDLQEKNIQLEETLTELKAALRKVELLESIKSNLSKFVPTAVTRLVENSTSSEIHEAQEQDISVLFLDIEGYTKITNNIGATNVNTLIERYFSVFMDAIYTNGGDVVETAGDGLMILFMTEDQEKNALQAVRAAQTIMEKASCINDECTLEAEKCLVNVGVSSGKAFVGAAKFDSITGSRWTYTTHGNIVNIAARLCGQAKGGQVFLTHETVRRTKEEFEYISKGKFALKNIAEDVEVFSINA